MINGRLEPEDLTPVSGTYLADTTATAFLNMAAACKAATGIPIDIVNGAGGYRDLAMQRAMYANRALYLPIVISYPGTSTHGLGHALDLTTTCFVEPAKSWLRANCIRYGFTRPPAGDPRHFQHNGTSTGPLAPATGNAEPITPTPGVKTMTSSPVIHAANGGIAQLFEVAPPKLFTLPELSIASATAKVYNPTGSYIEVTNEEFTVLVSANSGRAAAHDAKLALGNGNTGGGVSDAAAIASLAQQIAALSAQETANHAASLAAIADVDEETLATFGLKRA